MKVHVHFIKTSPKQSLVDYVKIRLNKIFKNNTDIDEIKVFYKLENDVMDKGRVCHLQFKMTNGLIEVWGEDKNFRAATQLAISKIGKQLGDSLKQ